MKRIFLILCCLFFFHVNAIYGIAKVGDELIGRVVRVLDGDTYDLLLSDNTSIRVRMYGIDAPEKAMPFNNVARKYLSEMCIQQQVRVVVKDIDMHGRIVALTYLSDGRELSHEMLRAGLAWHYRQYSSAADLAELEKVARTNKIGLWSEQFPVASWVVRKWNRKKIATKAIFADIELRKKASEASFE